MFCRLEAEKKGAEEIPALAHIIHKVTARWCLGQTAVSIACIIWSGYMEGFERVLPNVTCAVYRGSCGDSAGLAYRRLRLRLHVFSRGLRQGPCFRGHCRDTLNSQGQEARQGSATGRYSRCMKKYMTTYAEYAGTRERRERVCNR